MSKTLFKNLFIFFNLFDFSTAKIIQKVETTKYNLNFLTFFVNFND